MSPLETPEIKHLDGLYGLTLSLVTLLLSKKPDWKIVHCTVQQRIQTTQLQAIAAVSFFGQIYGNKVWPIFYLAEDMTI